MLSSIGRWWGRGRGFADEWFDADGGRLLVVMSGGGAYHDMLVVQATVFTVAAQVVVGAAGALVPHTPTLAVAFATRARRGGPVEQAIGRRGRQSRVLVHRHVVGASGRRAQHACIGRSVAATPAWPCQRQRLFESLLAKLAALLTIFRSTVSTGRLDFFF